MADWLPLSETIKSIYEYTCRLNGKIFDQWWIVNCHIWLQEGNMMIDGRSYV